MLAGGAKARGFLRSNSQGKEGDPVEGDGGDPFISPRVGEHTFMSRNDQMWPLAPPLSRFPLAPPAGSHRTWEWEKMEGEDDG
jgi:hypothetical protein